MQSVYYSVSFSVFFLIFRLKSRNNMLIDCSSQAGDKASFSLDYPQLRLRESRS